MFGFLSNLSPVEMGIIGLILLLVFGSKAFINIAKTSGQTYKEIKKIKKNFLDAVNDDEPVNKKKEV